MRAPFPHLHEKIRGRTREETFSWSSSSSSSSICPGTPPTETSEFAHFEDIVDEERIAPTGGEDLPRRLICQLIAYFYLLSYRRDAAAPACVRRSYAPPRRITRGRGEVLCRRRQLEEEESLSSVVSSLAFSHPSRTFAHSFVVLRPFLFLRPWPMNADPLMPIRLV